MVYNPYAKRHVSLKRPHPDTTASQNPPIPAFPPKPDASHNEADVQFLGSSQSKRTREPESIRERSSLQQHKPISGSRSNEGKPFAGNYKPKGTLHNNTYKPSSSIETSSTYEPRTELSGVHKARKSSYDRPVPKMGSSPSNPLVLDVGSAPKKPSRSCEAAIDLTDSLPTRDPSKTNSSLTHSRKISLSSPNPYAKTESKRSRNSNPPSNIARSHQSNFSGSYQDTTGQSMQNTVTHNRPKSYAKIGNPYHAQQRPPVPQTGGVEGLSKSLRVNQPAVGVAASIPITRPPSWTSKADGLTNKEVKKVETLARRPELPGEERLPDEISFDPSSITPIKDDYRRKLTTNAQLETPLSNGWTLYPHQKRAILKGLMKRRVVLALDMGLGKTLIGCVWSRAFKNTYEELKCYVICPATLKGEWKKTATEATRLDVEDDKKPPKDSLDLSICTWAKIPTKVHQRAKSFVFVFDEAHSMQSMDSARTKSSLRIIADPRCVGVLLLTGTPMKNGKPSNLFPLLKAVRHPLGRNQKAYEKHFCEGKLVNFGNGLKWHNGGKSNLKQLHRLIESNLLHLTKETCLAALPPMTHEKYHVPINPRYQAQYNREVRELDELRQAMKTNKNLDGKAMLGKTQTLRVLCAYAKIDATVELIRNVLEKEDAVVVFTNFAKAAGKIAEKLEDCGWKPSLLTGATNQNKRHEMVEKFQQGFSPVFVTTFGAGGVGITLTAARTAVFLDRPWTPGEMLQAQDRIRRIGQTRVTRAISMCAFELDTQVDAMLAEKGQAAKTVLGSCLDWGSSGSGGINTQKLLAALISRAK